jgi:hypothetical protein
MTKPKGGLGQNSVSSEPKHPWTQLRLVRGGFGRNPASPETKGKEGGPRTSDSSAPRPRWPRIELRLVRDQKKPKKRPAPSDSTAPRPRGSRTEFRLVRDSTEKREKVGKQPRAALHLARGGLRWNSATPETERKQRKQLCGWASRGTSPCTQIDPDLTQIEISGHKIKAR